MTRIRVCSLFTGIGGLELGLDKTQFEPALFCENDPAAQDTLLKNFPTVELKPDVVQLRSLPACDMLTAGWPCQDLSQAGNVRGMAGDRSSLVSEVFRLIRGAKSKPRVILLENVAFALHLHGGDAVARVTKELSDLGYRWAYRVLDTQFFGLPQRRRRVFILACLDFDPSQVLFAPAAPTAEIQKPEMIGFYWTEGNRGIGWTPEAVPPLKGGSSFSIPSPPAIWNRRNRTFFVPGIVDAEKLQGFPANWTRGSDDARSNRARWRLVGNAVSVNVAAWIGSRLSHALEGRQLDFEIRSSPIRGREHNAAAGGQHGSMYLRTASEGPTQTKLPSISSFEFEEAKPLSNRAASGFLGRLLASRLTKNPEFIRDLTDYCASEASISASKAA